LEILFFDNKDSPQTNLKGNLLQNKNDESQAPSPNNSRKKQLGEEIMVLICVLDLYLRFVLRQEHREPALPYFLQRFSQRFNGEKVDLFSLDAGHNSEPFQSFSKASTEPLQSLSRAS
jgi:hypothetical protein